MIGLCLERMFSALLRCSPEMFIIVCPGSDGSIAAFLEVHLLLLVPLLLFLLFKT
uniref:Uncharacterized protein n=1 Tax=Anguilla anguilla TaxID=7936 RepID=A0A0E9QAE3_ANGAN